MKKLIHFSKCSLVLILIINGFGQVEKKNSEKLKTISQEKKSISACRENSDKLYNRQRVLKELADILNKSVPEYFRVFRKPFAVENEGGNFFFVYDLTDSYTNSDLPTECIDFKNNHIYYSVN